MRELIDHYKQEPELLATLSEWLSEAGMTEAAIRAARSALRDGEESLSNERQADMHFLIGVKMRGAGQLDQAIYHLSEAVELSEEYLEAYLELAQAYQERRDFEGALAVYRQAINVSRGDYRPYYRMALMLKDNKEYLEAEALLRRAVQLAPDEVNVHRLLGAVVALNLVHNHNLTPIGA